MDTDWLLAITVRGRTFRLAGMHRLAESHVWQPGLDADIAAAPGVDDDIRITILDHPQLYALRDDLDTGTAQLWFYRDGATPVSTGRIIGVEYDGPGEPFGFTLTRASQATVRGRPLPDPTAQVDEATWPIDVLATLGSDGLPYPLIFGVPGWTGSGTPVPVVPCPVGQVLTLSPGDTYFVVNEDSDALPTTVRVLNQQTQTEHTQACRTVVDNLGRRIVVADCTSAGISSIPSSPNARILVGFGPSTGGGAARSLYDVAVYLLTRYGADSVDWSRLPDSEALLGRYNVDSWVDSTISDPWVLLAHWLEHLPAVIRVGPAGYYFVEQRYQHDPANVRGSLVVRAGDSSRFGSVTREGLPANEVTVRYRPDTQQGYRAVVIATGSIQETLPRQAQPSTWPANVYQDPLAVASYTRYRYRPADPIELDWTWDAATAQEVARSVLARRALPGLLVGYDLPHNTAAPLVEGGEYLLTDDELGWADRPAILADPPVYSLGSVRAVFRIPQEAT